ncbi:MAG: hypothetical protein JNM56_05180 [Planctomycetia bacterium]|nr:hypothetical protein [Planctomycetia bacterium]
MTLKNLLGGAFLLAVCFLPAAEPEAGPAGIYEAKEVAGSPKLVASGMVWWQDRLIIADRGNKRLLAFTPPDFFETFKELRNPVGVAVDPDGNLIVTEKDVVNRLPRNISRLAFGGTDRRTLFIIGAGEYRLHQVRLPVPGS